MPLLFSSVSRAKFSFFTQENRLIFENAPSYSANPEELHVETHPNAPADALSAHNDIQEFLTNNQDKLGNLKIAMMKNADAEQVKTVLGVMKEPEKTTGSWSKDHFPKNPQTGQENVGKLGMEAAIIQALNLIITAYGSTNTMQQDGRILQYEAAQPGKEFLNARLEVMELLKKNNGAENIIGKIGKNVTSYEFLEGLQEALQNIPSTATHTEKPVERNEKTEAEKVQEMLKNYTFGSGETLLEAVGHNLFQGMEIAKNGNILVYSSDAQGTPFSQNFRYTGTETETPHITPENVQAALQVLDPAKKLIQKEGTNILTLENTLQ